MISVKVEATRGVETQLIVVRETERLIRSRWIGMRGWIAAPLIHFCPVQLPNAEDNRLMACGSLIIQKVSVETGRTEEGPAIDVTNRAVQPRRLIEFVNEQIGDIACKWAQL